MMKLSRNKKSQKFSKLLNSRKCLWLIIPLFLFVFQGKAQTDSLEFKSTQEKLIGCWKTKYSQFKYNIENNTGGEYKSRTRSTAPFFNLVIIDDEIYMEWIELLGGSHLSKIVWIKKNRIKVENGNGYKFVYKRNKGCK